MLKKLNIKLISLQSLALIFLTSGIKDIYLAIKSDYYEAIINNTAYKLPLAPDQTIGSIFLNQIYWTLTGFIFGTLLIGLINRLYKTPPINTLIIFLIVFVLFPLGQFYGGILQLLLNSFCYLFSEDMSTAFITGGVIFMLISLGLILKSTTLYHKNNFIVKN